MSNPSPGRDLGFVGLGNMGAPMSSRLLAGGHRVAGYDPRDEARERLTAAGGTAVNSLQELDDVDALILMLPSSEVVEHVLLTEGLAGRLQPGTVIIDMSSSEPLKTQGLASEVGKLGVRLLDAPVSGGVKGAEKGTLSIMVGGRPEDFAAVSPILELLGNPRLVGPVGAGHALKALNNLMSATHLWITSEALIAGQRFGLDPAVMLSVVNSSSGRSGSTESKWPSFVLPGTFDSGFALQLMLKDMRIATGLARAVGAPSDLADAAVERWARAADDLDYDADHTEVARWIYNAAHTASTT